MPRGLRRYYGRGDLHFLTFSCHRRLPLLGTATARNLFVDVLGKIRLRYSLLLVGYVVMPEHVHLLVSEPAGSTPSKVVQALKQRVSRDLRDVGPSGGTSILPGFWQPRFYDFNVRSSEKRREKLDYMHLNPVKRGLVKEPGEWAWSSYSCYEKGQPGLVPIDPVD
ncbi:MAG: transposase [Acidobacteriota bacterium]|nr:transposase [Acidobacteriota bacterium]